MAESRYPSLSVMVQRSRNRGHRAYVRIGLIDAGYRELETGEIYCVDEQYIDAVAWATAGLMTAPPAEGAANDKPVPTPSLAEVSTLVTPAATFPAARLRPIRSNRSEPMRQAS
jgi:hypothetical protein